MRGEKNTWRMIRHGAFILVFGSLLISSIHTTIQWISPALDGEAAGAERRDYALLLAQCVLGMALSFLPVFAERKWPHIVMDAVFASYYIFLFCAIFLGEVFDFFHRVPSWDSFLHVFSGMMFCSLGFAFARTMGGNAQVSPFFAALFAFCFSLACGTVWEAYEFIMDSMTNMNMQKYMTEAGMALIGQDALFDTMKDILCNIGGAVGMVGCFALGKRNSVQ